MTLAPRTERHTLRDVRLHDGTVLPSLALACTTLGAPDGELVLLLHGSQGSAASWLTPAWAGRMFGPGQPLDAASRRQRSEGVRVLLLDRGFEGGEIADLPWLLPGAKSLSYGINMAAKRYAVANGADDVIFRAPSGKLLEGPTSSVVSVLPSCRTSTRPSAAEPWGRHSSVRGCRGQVCR